MIKEVEILKNHSHLLAIAAQGFFIPAVDQAAFQKYPAAVRGDQVIDALKQGAFSGARRADQHLDFAGVDRQRDIIQNRTIAELLVKIFNLLKWVPCGFL